MVRGRTTFIGTGLDVTAADHNTAFTRERRLSGQTARREKGLGDGPWVGHVTLVWGNRNRNALTCARPRLTDGGRIAIGRDREPYRRGAVVG
jgi:hypothetical protein